jgi:GST-like protein
MMELYGMNSPNVRKVTTMLEGLALPYKTHIIDMTASDQYKPEFLALNPNNKVPVLVPEGPGGKPDPMIESGAIPLFGHHWAASNPERPAIRLL